MAEAGGPSDPDHQNREAYRNYLDRARKSVEFKLREAQACPRESIDDYKLVGILGEGGCGTVVLATKGPRAEHFAIKVIRKSSIEIHPETKEPRSSTRKQRCLKAIFDEKHILYAVQSAFVVKMFCTAQDAPNVYIVMEFAKQGCFTRLMEEYGPELSERNKKMYVAQIILALEYLHNAGIMYRDLKPDNVLVFDDGYLKLSDFGLSTTRASAVGVYGTPDYMAPEIYANTPYTAAVDWWALGVLIYEMIFWKYPRESKPSRPFDVASESKWSIQEQHILQHGFSFKAGAQVGETSIEVRRLIEELMTKDPSRRLGNTVRGIDGLKEHAWFSGISFHEIFHKRYDLSCFSILPFKDPKPITRAELIPAVEKDYAAEFANF